jgi:formate hydrogenlyase subunit 6/NADH:ubiquinone oxidoreductase subunit I
MTSMFEIFRRSLKTGVVTTGYPATPEPAPLAYRGQVQIDVSRCVGHGECMRVCPSLAISVRHDDAGGWVWELDDARCVFCGLCAEACPEQALALSNEYELAVRDDADLVTSVTFQPGNEGAS